MSLKAFHIVFVIASTLLAFGFGGWMLLDYRDEQAGWQLALGVSSLASGVGLLAYGRYVLKKLKNVSYL
ncbi:MAG: hypothetical protein HZA89_07485 [Verrucomicrobia bacterium]|nr:hypothetical protein [Verrucomicrobiota bacterium]